MDDDQLTRPANIGPEAYVSPEYARAEQERLWRKTWLQAGRVEDIPEVGALLLLCSDAGAWITGQTLHIDGGWVLRP